MNKLKQLIRYVRYMLIWLFVEKPRGIDFHMRQKKIGIHSDLNNGYSLSPGRAVVPALKRINACKYDCLIDIGCGKGGVLYKATKFDLKRIAGVEIEKNIFDIAVKNFRKLKLSHRIELYNYDALDFEDYYKFNIFYLFNPFPLEIYRQIIFKIIDAAEYRAEKDRIYIICYGLCDEKTIMESGKFVLYDSFVDDEKNKPVRIYQYKNFN